MFSGRINFSDLNSPLVIDGEGIFFGSSGLHPFQHRLLFTEILISRKRVAIFNSERFSDESSGFLDEKSVRDELIDDRIKQYHLRFLDFSAIIIDRESLTFSCHASSIVYAPFYLKHDPGGVSIDWDYRRLLKDTDIDVAWDVVITQIQGIMPYGHRTVVEGVVRTTAGAILAASKNGIEISLPYPVTFSAPFDQIDNGDIERHFISALEALLGARPLENRRTAVELSGGMDSALSSMIAKNLLGDGLFSITAQFDGTMGAAQQERCTALIQAGGFDNLNLPAARLAPFGETSLRRVRYGVMPEDESYPEIFEASLGVAQAAGIDTLISGLGGDELYVIYEDEDGGRNREHAANCPFLTEAGQNYARTVHISYPAGWLAESCWYSSASRSQRLLRHGIWPVYPYQNIQLSQFISKLPYKYRSNRNILRKSISLLLNNDMYERAYVKETFDPVAIRGIKENESYLSELVRSSRISNHKYLKNNKILSSIRSDFDKIDRHTYNCLFQTLKVLCFFQ
ncbi:asparagine synthase [Gluconacetobacter diazotrophicus]|uniref:asparagine synthase n=1 Tax=Gluconacetobacter diazotrophicus TaxID=33996 RepID=UPI001198E500|nr:asparagine synthase [Gluconacetobacter diazotrophicus]TWB05169.1 asparagine synthase (glutamine-hydrolysing) [Gluconacetobacter diazotrophicus]